jgi:hypothetical protein
LVVRISGTALAKVIRHTVLSPRREVAGLLIGRERDEELLVRYAAFDELVIDPVEIVVEEARLQVFALMIAVVCLLRGQRRG